MVELVFACFIGILIGTLTGMIPGIHVNTAGAILFASSAFLLGFLSPEFLCVLMVSMSIAHALTEFVPSMLLGVPQEGTATSILPGHRMVLQGRSKEVIRIVAVGGFGAIVITILMMPVFAVTLPFLHELTNFAFSFSLFNLCPYKFKKRFCMVIIAVFAFRNFGMGNFPNSNFIRSFFDVYFFRIIWNKYYFI